MDELKDHLGFVYSSVRELAEAYGIKTETLRTRLKKGMDIKEALLTPSDGMYNSYKCKDHLGNEFSSVRKMCKHYNILPQTYRQRIKKGWSLERALTVKADSMESAYAKRNGCTDYLGNEFPSIQAMCDYHGTSYSAYSQRRRRGLTGADLFKKAMSKHDIDTHDGVVKDHTGKEYESRREMCEHWDIPMKVYYARMKRGYTVEQALTEELNEDERRHYVYDHKGNRFSSVSQMCKAYGVSDSYYYSHLRTGSTMEEALTIPDTIVHDHLGNGYNTYLDMCNHYGITYNTFNRRIDSGKTLEEALTTPLGKSHIQIPCVDNTGKVFQSIRAMCKYHNAPYESVIKRVRRGTNPGDAILLSKGERVVKVKDHLGNEYKSVGEMCKRYNVPLATYYYRKNHGMSTEKCLSNSNLKSKKIV